AVRSEQEGESRRSVWQSARRRLRRFGQQERLQRNEAILPNHSPKDRELRKFPSLEIFTATSTSVTADPLPPAPLCAYADRGVGGPGPISTCLFVWIRFDFMD